MLFPFYLFVGNTCIIWVELETLFPDAEVTEYNPQLAMVIARCMADINGKVTAHGASYAQQYILQKGLKKFKERGSDAAIKELDQLHKRNCFTPVEIASLTKEERRKAQEALMFLTEKRDQSCKGHLVYNGKPTRERLSREDNVDQGEGLKGKTTQQKQVVEPLDSEIMQRYKHVNLCPDSMYINGILFIITMSCHIRFGTVEALVNR